MSCASARIAASSEYLFRLAQPAIDAPVTARRARLAEVRELEARQIGQEHDVGAEHTRDGAARANHRYGGPHIG